MTDKTSVKNSPPPQGTYILSGNEMSLDELGDILESTIKYDSPTKKILFLGMLLNYTEEDQQNFAFNSPSSTGKSFVALEVATYFPEEDLMHLSYTSPTAFFHSQGVLVDENLSPLQDRRDYVSEQKEVWEESNPQPEKGEGRSAWKDKYRDEVRKLKSEWDQMPKFYLVDLKKKIIIFLDQPHDDLLKKLRPLLSHDMKQLPIKITDKTREGGHKTKDILLLGFPTVVFISVKASLDEQEKTRTFLLSPEVTQDKLKASIIQSADHLSDRKAFKERLAGNPDRLKLMGHILDVKNAEIQEILLTPEDRDYITKKFLEEHKPLEPRHQRDFPRLISLIKAHAFLNLYNRERGQGKVWVNRHDCNEGYNLYKEVSTANEQGVPPYMWDFWVTAVKPQLYEEGLTRKHISILYKDHYQTRIGEKALKNLIETLAEAGLVYEGKDPDDRRFIKIYPLGGGGNNFTQVEAGKQMIERAASLLIENGGGLPHRDFYVKMNELGYHDSDINAVVFSDVRFHQAGMMVYFEEGS